MEKKLKIKKNENSEKTLSQQKNGQKMVFIMKISHLFLKYLERRRVQMTNYSQVILKISKNLKSH